MNTSNWIPPINGVVKINVDGSYNEDTNHFGNDIVLRDYIGTCLGIKGRSGDEALNPEAVECMTVIEALSWAKDLKYTRIEIEANGKLVIESINGKILPIQCENKNLIKEIKHLISSFLFCEFIHVSHDDNQVEDVVAKHVRKKEILILSVENFNPGICGLLPKDHNPC
ncbi:uncharacterized protein LOC113304149 [Papaver somniferum]|uniref:uncharacterized protein LOC113304149 n=1 Tax=Papaver somniferum TaxID=3469 RepID=UPI000E70236D|nr:uncharacterized protein LOC113304149 [Papaver somniferum]